MSERRRWFEPAETVATKGQAVQLVEFILAHPLRIARERTAGSKTNSVIATLLGLSRI